jgi:hypothetical protein
MFNTEKGPSVAGAEEKPHAKFNGSKHNSQDYIEQFREFARQKGFELPAKIVADGEKQRFGPKDACAYVLHLDGVPNGWVQDWRQGATRHQWKANGRKLNHEERERADLKSRLPKPNARRIRPNSTKRRRLKRGAFWIMRRRARRLTIPIWSKKASEHMVCVFTRETIRGGATAL